MNFSATDHQISADHLSMINGRSIVPQSLLQGFSLGVQQKLGRSAPVAAAGPPRNPNEMVFSGSGESFVGGGDSIPDENNVQGEMYTVFPKGAEEFVFFTISNLSEFKKFLRAHKFATAADVAKTLTEIYNKKCDPECAVKDKTIIVAHSQIGFSRSGLDYLGFKERVQDPHFDQGSMLLQKSFLNDSNEWDLVFREGKVHGVITVAGESPSTCLKEARRIANLIKPSTKDVVIQRGKDRPEPNKGHEHFGYLDGISQPALRGLAVPKEGQLQVDPGVIVMGYKGDPNVDNPKLPKRPDWTKDGTLMVFRKLEQDVVRFERYKTKNGKRWREYVPEEYKGKVELTDLEGSDLFGAQIFGRWKSGTPLQLAPIRDDPKFIRSNAFDYRVEGISEPTDLRCPFTAHIRKVAPRNLDPYFPMKFVESAAIVRSSIPYGSEVTFEEQKVIESVDGKDNRQLSEQEKDELKRGLLFVCYQSSLSNGFIRQTIDFAGNDYFPVTSLHKKYGQDPILGGGPDPRPNTYDQEFFVTSRGGEYFFIPSMATLKRMAQ